MDLSHTTTPDLGLGPIDDVNLETRVYVWSRHGILFGAVCVFSLACCAGLGYMTYLSATNGVGNNANSFILPFLPLLFPVILYRYYKQRIEHLFIQQMAAAMGFTYSASAPRDSALGAFFSIGNSQRLSDVMMGTYKDRPVRIYTYQYTIGGGRDRHTFFYTVFEMDYGAPLPHVLMNVPELIAPSDVEKVELEGNFDEHFKLYVSKGQQMEIREIFQPDVMQDLIASFDSFSMEMYGAKVYLIRKIILNKKQVVIDLVNLADHLFAEIIPELHAIAVPAATATSQQPAPLAQP